VRLANRCLDQVRGRVQNATLGHRGRRRDPFYRIRKLALTGVERLEDPALERTPRSARWRSRRRSARALASLAKEWVRDV
jgi:hypothetical protein